MVNSKDSWLSGRFWPNGGAVLFSGAWLRSGEVWHRRYKGGVGGTVARESAVRSAGTVLSRVRAPPPASWPKIESLKA
ncbi:hypothetical protein PoB_000646200 [Plakobranchus ocellatus]|uniref:Uncharacterized protein n=1 Tax=Plakobranchus ocellatus TaxID=259542 RepID=A0AAV3YCY1_9GAST|nr:hypothetical protein PoB_000646200 [Plakobranchus ocellatus]